jgi:tetratricopeptide (TPR) repeat protein
MARRVLDVFLSSTALDLTEHRKAVHERLTGTGLFHCVWQEGFGARDSGAVEFCRKNAQGADIFVGLVGLRRGWEPDGDNQRRSITEMEHDWAREATVRRYIWVAPDDMPMPGHIRESDAAYERQVTFRKRIMGEQIVSQKGFGSPDLLASEVVEQLLVRVVTTDLLNLLRPEAQPENEPLASREEKATAVASAVEKLAEDEDVDLLALAKNPRDVDVTELEAKLRIRAEAYEANAKRDAKKSAEYWRHIGALAFLHDTKRALDAYTKATELDPDDPDGWNQLGHLQSRTGDLGVAVQSYERVLALGNSVADHSIVAAASNNLGTIYSTLGDLVKAEKLHNQALSLHKKFTRRDGMAVSYANLSVIYAIRNKLDVARGLLEKSLALNEAIERKEGIAADYGNLGILLTMQGDFDLAEAALHKSLGFHQELGHKQEIASNYSGLARLYFARGNFDRAQAMVCESLLIENDLGHKEGAARDYGNLGLINKTRGDMAEACVHWRKARDLWRHIGNKAEAAEYESLLREAGCSE